MNKEQSIQKTLELLEMVEFILHSKAADSPSGSRASLNQEQIVPLLPLAGLKHSVSESIDILRGILRETQSESLDSVIDSAADRTLNGAMGYSNTNIGSVGASPSVQSTNEPLDNRGAVIKAALVKEALHGVSRSIDLSEASSDKKTAGIDTNKSFSNLLNDVTMSPVSSPNLRDEEADVSFQESQRSRIKIPREGSASTSGSGLAGRIRPVPEEVRGRVRELVDMIENNEEYIR